MRAFLVFLVLALVAMATAHDRVKVVDRNPQEVHVVNNNPGDVHFVDNNPYDNSNPGHVHVVNNNPGDVHFVDNNPYDGNNPGHVIIPNPDSAFGRPTNPQTGGEPVDISPVYANRPPYPIKHYDNPYARGGK